MSLFKKMISFFLIPTPKKESDPEGVSEFYMAGGRPTYQDWKTWDQAEKESASLSYSRLQQFDHLVRRLDMAQDDCQKLAIAEELREFDGGELARSLRMEMNRRALQ